MNPTEQQQKQINTWVNVLLGVPSGTYVYTHSEERDIFNTKQLRGCSNLGSERATVDFMDGASAPLLRIKAMEVSFTPEQGHDVIMLLR